MAGRDVRDVKARAALARSTLQALELGSYSLDGEEVELSAALQEAVAGTELWPEGDLPRPAGDPGGDPGGEATVFEVTGETTLQAGQRLHGELQGAGSPCVLSFASAKNPGGGFQGGADAQEESLARSSGLHPCLLPHVAGFYAPHRQDPRDGLYSHAMLYSPGVPFFREDSGAPCQLWRAAVITSPAPNAGVALDRGVKQDELLSTLRERCGRILRLASARGHAELVLGAFGCGVFRNDPVHVAKAFHFWLRGSGKFAGTFRRVIFAIPGAQGANHQAFQAHFGSGATLGAPVRASGKGAAKRPGRGQRTTAGSRSGAGDGTASPMPPASSHAPVPSPRAADGASEGGGHAERPQDAALAAEAPVGRATGVGAAGGEGATGSAIASGGSPARRSVGGRWRKDARWKKGAAAEGGCD